jgi:hypothetical protein
MLAIAAMVLLAFAAVGFFRFRRVEAPPVPRCVVSVAAPEITLIGTVQAAHVVNVPVPVDGALDHFMPMWGNMFRRAKFWLASGIRDFPPLCKPLSWTLSKHKTISVNLNRP